MTQDEQLLELMQRLDMPAARYNELDLYYTGRQPRRSYRRRQRRRWAIGLE